MKVNTSQGLVRNISGCVSTSVYVVSKSFQFFGC
jgi:hypothetical protein